MIHKEKKCFWWRAHDGANGGLLGPRDTRNLQRSCITMYSRSLVGKIQYGYRLSEVD